MISLRALVDPEAVRAFNVAFLRRGINYVVVDETLDNRAQILQMINSVPRGSIEALLEAVPPFREEHAELAWAHFMAAGAGLQLWPDANHRTSMLTFDAALREAMDETIALAPADARTMLLGSKAIIQKNPTFPGQPVFSIEDIASPYHPLRRHFEEFAGRLIWTSES